jgi:hypothetical protein
MKRGMIIGIAAGGLVLILFWYFVLYSPTSSDLDDTKSQVAEAQQHKQGWRRGSPAGAERSRRGGATCALNAAVPRNPDHEFILQANNIATASGVD